VKSEAKVEFVIANGAECEPLVHKDVELMQNYPAEILSGLRLMMRATDAQRGIFGLKEKNAAAVEAIRSCIGQAEIDVVLLGDFYPSGDEYELVHIATGRLIPPAGIPLQVGCVVNNVETLYNVNLAVRDTPVTRKFISVTGAVKEPKSFWVPIGTTFRDVLGQAGGTTVSEFGLFVLTFDLDDAVTKTTAGLIVLPRDYYLVTRKDRTPASMNRIGKSACDQCSYCTEFCPRYLLGYEIEPHKVMRSLGFTATGKDIWNQWAELCCACGLCTLYACPEDLYPKEACDGAKADMGSAGIKFVQEKPVRVHPMKEHRRVPLSLLRKRMKVEEYESDAPFDDLAFEPSRVKIKLKQHTGAPAKPVIRSGQKVGRGDVIAAVEPPALGADIHASIDGTVKAITDTYIEIEA
jgi:Na+-translocating ferredoxin:NAD+ oxidoreductase RnfC subunit